MLTLDSTGFPSTIWIKVMFCSSVCVAETLRYTFSYQKSESNPSNAFHVKYDLNTQCAERPHHGGKSNLTFEGRGCQIGERLFVIWVNRTWTNNQMNTCQITKRKLTK